MMSSPLKLLKLNPLINPTPTTPLKVKLLALGLELRALLLDTLEKAHRRLKATSYSTYNKAGKAMALRL